MNIIHYNNCIQNRMFKIENIVSFKHSKGGELRVLSLLKKRTLIEI
jgi:hypothetical protein